MNSGIHEREVRMPAMRIYQRISLVIRTKGLPLLMLILAGCSSPALNYVQPELIIVAPVFPPQEVMESGNYEAFLQENETALQECKDDVQCAIAMFNLGFIHAYPKSPQHNRSKGLEYFEQLIAKYPQSPWAIQAKAWTELVKKTISLEASQNRLKGQIRAKGTTIKELQKQIEQSREVDLEIDKKEKELQKQIERSRQIDIEMDRRERELLQ
jgi:hypothetical protein